MEMNLQAVGLTLVGQIPDLGIYLLEIENDNTDPQMAIETLDQVIEALRGYERVDTVSYNELLELNFVENDDDNSDFNGHDRCAFATIDYYQAIPIFDQVMPHLTLNEVTVAVIDSGLWVDSEQFDEIRPRIYNLNNPGSDPTDWSPTNHGTRVTSIIAADNGDGMTNGIALRVLGNNLSLIVSGVTIPGDRVVMHWALASARQAVERVERLEEGKIVVNLSLGRHDHGNRPPWLVAMQAQFMRLFKASPDVLFVAAAPNETFALDNNAVPAGLPNSNLITVGGRDSCNFENPAPFSATGPAG